MNPEIEFDSDFPEVRLLNQFAIFSESDLKLNPPKFRIILVRTADGLNIDRDLFCLFELFCSFDLGQQQVRSLKR